MASTVHSPALSAELSATLKRIHDHCQNYKQPVLHRSVLQALLTFTLFICACAGIIFAIKNDLFWLSSLLTLPAAGLLVKIFIIQHDCGHGSYFKTKAANTWLGRIFSLITLTPYAFWRDAHNRHHATSGNLSKRGIGAIDTLTLQEFEKLGPWQKRFYKLYRHPAVMVLIGPPLYIILLQRFPMKGPMPYTETYQSISGKHLWQSVMSLNLSLIIVYGGFALIIGWQTVLLAFLPVSFIAASIGGWLFYVQHQYEDSYWEHQDSWDYRAAALLGSSHYDLPKLLHWFTGNIGFHHIHHLSSLIPNYRLPECYAGSLDLKRFPKMTMLESLKTAKLRFWDEGQKKMVTA